MLDIAALTKSERTPSSRFRIRQHIGPLRALGIVVTDYPTPPIIELPFTSYRAVRGVQLGIAIAANVPRVLRSRSASAVWISRTLLSGRNLLERWCGQPRVLDVDDAIWIGSPRLKDVVRQMDVVIAGNTFLADWFSQYCERVFVVNTAIDVRRFVPAEPVPDRDTFIIGWTGLADNLTYVYAIESTLARFLRDHSRARLCILCNAPPRFKEIPAARVDFIRWTPANEAVTLTRFDVGLMPLRDGDWERGKCSFKMLQYMATGLPVVVSPVGLNVDILAMGAIGFEATTDAAWYDALHALYGDQALAHRYGIAGRALAEKRFSVDYISAQLAAIFRSEVQWSSQSPT